MAYTWRPAKTQRDIERILREGQEVAIQVGMHDYRSGNLARSKAYNAARKLGIKVETTKGSTGAWVYAKKKGG